MPAGEGSAAVAENKKEAEAAEQLRSPPPPAERLPVAPVTTIPPPAAPKPYWARGFGWAMMAGGAYQDFTNTGMKSTTQAGGGWAARFIGGTNSIIGFEAAYIGAANSSRAWASRNNTPLLVPERSGG